MPPNENFLIFPNIPHSEMVFVKGGSFRMGSDEKDADDEKPVHAVTVPDFYIGKYLVTQTLWKKVIGEVGSWTCFKGKNRPIERVSWNTITQEFLQKLPDKGIEGWGYNLPSEAMWEFAAKGGIKSKQYKYSGSNDSNEVGWYDENSHMESKSVGLKAPNELGLYDMSGNVSEWCLDHWHETYDNSPNDGSAWIDINAEKDKYQILRGGGWLYYQSNSRPSARDSTLPDDAHDSVGFRLVFSFIS